MKFKKILPHIYHLHMEKNYDLAMHFLRYQEFYENLDYKGQIISLVDYMEYYAREYGDGAFTYTNDWAGFNVPGETLIEVSEAHLPDLNKYDIQMRALVKSVQEEEGDEKFYFIGTCGNDDFEEDTLDHEIAHALYYTSDSYRKIMNDLLNEIPRKNYDTTWNALQEMRYHPATCRDEIHAYACTGPDVSFKTALSLKIRKPFIKAYKEQRKIHVL